MKPLIDDDDAYEEAMLAIAKLRTDTNGSPHGAIGDRPRNAIALSGRSASAHDALLHSPSGASSPLSLVDALLGPASMAPLVRDLPTPPANVEEEDPAFKNDLAHVLVWFTDDLSTTQRLSAVYTLARHLTSPQKDLLIKCLGDEGEGSREDSKIVGKNDFKSATWLGERPSHTQWHTPEPQRPPPGLISWSLGSTSMEGRAAALDSAVRSTGSMGSLPQRVPPSPPSSLAAKAATAAEDAAPVNAELFHTDLPGWLRLHRLHKYETALVALDRSHLLKLDEPALEALGVAALGARRKFARLFGAVRQASASS